MSFRQPIRRDITSYNHQARASIAPDDYRGKMARDRRLGAYRAPRVWGKLAWARLATHAMIPM
jgi:hypothetical protein